MSFLSKKAYQIKIRGSSKADEHFPAGFVVSGGCGPGFPKPPSSFQLKTYLLTA